MKLIKNFPFSLVIIGVCLCLANAFSTSVSHSSNAALDKTSYVVNQSKKLSNGQVPDIFLQTLNRNGAEHSTAHGDYFFSDHASIALREHNITDDTIDNVTVSEIIWMFENRFYYQHSFVILKTLLTVAEQELFPNLTYKYYVTEKNDLGIIWQLFYTYDEAVNIKTEHDGFKWNREHIHTIKTKDLTKRNKYTVGDVKKYFNQLDSTHYHLLLKNCNWYAKDVYNFIKGGQIFADNGDKSFDEVNRENGENTKNIKAYKQNKKQEKEKRWFRFIYN